METLTKHEIARHLGIDVARAIYGTQDARLSTHGHLKISQLVVEHATDKTEREIIAFRVRDMETGETWTKLPDEGLPVDAAKVDALYDDVMSHQRLVNLTLHQAIGKAIPELDTGSETIVSIQVGGKDRIADLVDGSLRNIRDPVVRPSFSVGRDGVLVCDLTGLCPEHQEKAHAAIVAASDRSVLMKK